MNTVIRLAVAGAAGRTGSRVVALAGNDARFALVAALTSSDDLECDSHVRRGTHEEMLTASLEVPCDVVIEFAGAAGSMHWLGVCRERGIPLVMASTGHTAQQLATLSTVAKRIPVVKAANFSVGVHLLTRLVRTAAEQLGMDYDVEIVETHHRHKVDAPSGTANMLLDVLSKVVERPANAIAAFGRQGEVGPRPKGQVGVHAVRMGDVIGRHEVHFSGPGETLTLTHAAQSRDPYAVGALRAAQWVVGQPPGVYTLDAVLGPAADGRR